MDDQALSSALRRSLERQQNEMRSTLLLNPVENVPFADDLAVAAGPLHGLYASDKVRTRAQQMEAPIQFAGRRAIAEDCNAIYRAWADAVGAEEATLRTLSGLHAHLVIFLSIAQAGDSVLLLPVEAGGHMSGRAIVDRLGLRVTEMVVDDAARSIDVTATIELVGDDRPDFVFVDRSEGLVVEDLSALAALATRASIFDASQYLTNIISGDHPNPLSGGFDLLVATVHKNFPGPQKAVLACRERDDTWLSLVKGASTYVSNFDATSTYAAGLALARREWLAAYSREMLQTAVALESELAGLGVPVVRRDDQMTPTHHLWMTEPDREAAFESYESLEACGLLANYRLLPYGLGYGLRLGTSGAVRTGLRMRDVPELAELIALVRSEGATPALRARARELSQRVWSEGLEPPS